MAAIVKIAFDQHVELPAEKAYQLLCDWEDHGRWVPLTKVVLHSPDAFTAYTGLWPLRLKDEMRVSFRDDGNRHVAVEKLGPILTGSAGFKVRYFSPTSSVVSWIEEVRVPYLPQFTAAALRPIARMLFRKALRNLA